MSHRYAMYLFLTHVMDIHMLIPYVFSKSVLLVQCAKFHMITFYHKAKVEVPELFMWDN